MKYLFAALMSLVMLVVSGGLDVSAAEMSGNEAGEAFGYVEDKDGIIGDGEAALLRLEAAAGTTGWCVGICTGIPLDSGESRYDSVFGERDGVILFINKGVAKVVARGSAAEYVTGERAKNIVRLVDREMRHERSVNIPEVFAGRLEGLRQKGAGSFDLYPPALVIAVAAAFTAGFGTVLWIGRRYSPGEAPAVNNYLDVRSIEVYRKTDEQLFSKSVRYRNNIIQQMVRGEGVFRRRR